MGLVEHQVVQARAGEKFDVAAAGQQQFQLLHVGEQDARLAARRPHRFARAHFLSGVDGFSLTVFSRLLQPRPVVSPGRTGGQAEARHSRLPFRRLADVDAERNTGPGQQVPEPQQLVLGERVHGVDDHGADARRRVLVPQRQALADDGVEKALGLARAGACGHQCGPSLGDGPNRLFLVAVQVSDRLGNAFAEMRVQQPVGHQVLHRRALPERAGQADVRSLQQGRLPGLVQREEVAHLAAKPLVHERIGRELVPQEAADDLLGVGDGVQGHLRRLILSINVKDRQVLLVGVNCHFGSP